MFKRIIKDENKFTSKNISSVPENTTTLHPITGNIIDTRGYINPICLTKLHISNNKLKIYDNYVCNGENKYKEYIQLPPFGLSSSDLLQIYNINNIDNLNYWIETNIEEYNIFTLNRVLNCWIINNIDILKIHNNFLESICKLLLEKGKYIEDKIIEHDNFNKEVKYFIDYWIDNYNTDDKNLDLLNDLKNYLYKKLDFNK